VRTNVQYTSSEYIRQYPGGGYFRCSDATRRYRIDKNCLGERDFYRDYIVHLARFDEI
jgi:hypothetical protein